MKRLLFLAILSACPSAVSADPVVTSDGDGVIDWTNGVIRVVGVGTPEVLSPTGGLTNDELKASALSDAVGRIRRILQRLYRQTSTPSPAASELERLASRLTVHRRLRASDGTVHLHATFPLGALHQHQCPTNHPPVVIKLDRAIKPTVTLALASEGETLQLSLMSRHLFYADRVPTGIQTDRLVHARVNTNPAISLRIDGPLDQHLRAPCSRLLFVLPEAE